MAGSRASWLERKQNSELHADAAIDGERLRRRDRAGVRQRRDESDGAWIEERSVGGELVVEQVGHETEDLHLLAHLIRRVQVDVPIGGQLRVLVGIVAD